MINIAREWLERTGLVACNARRGVRETLTGAAPSLRKDL